MSNVEPRLHRGPQPTNVYDAAHACAGSVTAAAKLDKVRTMTTWRYVASRVRDQASYEESWEIRELFLEEDGRFSFTNQAIAPAGNTLEELQRDLDTMRRGSQQQPHLDLTGNAPRLADDGEEMS